MIRQEARNVELPFQLMSMTILENVFVEREHTENDKRTVSCLSSLAVDSTCVVCSADDNKDRVARLKWSETSCRRS